MLTTSTLSPPTRSTTEAISEVLATTFSFAVLPEEQPLSSEAPARLKSRIAVTGILSFSHRG
ncbi:MAG: hypothetical protein V3V43_04435 [Dehalococcoidales bacterium]